MSGHTKGLLHVSPQNADPDEGHLHIGGNSVTVLASMNPTHPDTPANVARIVACWNACDGLNPEAVGDMREALEEIAEMTVARNVPREDIEKIARAALARAEKE